MKISVIIPTYKPGNYFKHCIASLQSQTIDKSLFEVIIILNGCNEPWYTETNELIRNYLSDININLIQTDLPGVSNARNIGIDNARGEYLTFLDDDDYISPTYLDELLKCSSPNCVGLTDSIYIDDLTGKEIVDNAHHRRFDRIRLKNNPSLLESRVFFNGPVMKLLHRNIISDRRFDKRFKNGEDSLFMFLISDKIKTLKYTTCNAIYYRRIRENSATTVRRDKMSILKNCLKLMIQYSMYYFQAPTHYNFIFYVTRELATVKNLLLGQ